MRSALLLLLVSGCSSTLIDPLEPQAPDPEALTDVSSDLDALLERGALEGACDRLRAGATDRRTRLLCGKWMFFYEHFGTLGVPTAIAEFMVNQVPDQVGPGFLEMGMITDPRSQKKLPLGLAPGKPFAPGADSVVYTCASCHFGQLPDGRYAVGQANHRFEYGQQILALTLAPILALGLSTPDSHDATAVARVQPIIDHIKNTPGLSQQLFQTVLPLAQAGMMPTLTAEIEHYYATWPPGTMDFVIAPLPIDDHVHTISKIIPLWGIPSRDEEQAAGMPHAMLAWTGVVHSLLEFARGFVLLGDGARGEWPDERLQPLVDYVLTLRAPQSPTPPDATLVARGRGLFTDKGCVTCHDGPRGSGKQLYGYDEIGTDAQMKRWLDPDLSGKACCGVTGDTAPTHQLKSPRLAGAWALRRFLHNGSLGSLEELFCLSGPRGTITTPAYGDAGHGYTCTLDPDEKSALIAYLKN